MKRIRYLSLMLCCLSLSVDASKYLIENYDLSDSQSISGSVWAMVQAENGVLYFGSDNGISTFDGVRWEYMEGLPVSVRSLFIDSSGQIYYGGIEDFGLLKHDIRKGLYPISLKDKLERTFDFSDIWSIAECDKRIFFQSKNYVFVLEDEQLKTIPLDNSYHRANVIDGKFMLNRQSIGLSFYKDGDFQILKNGEYFKDFIISGMIQIPSGDVLIFTRRNGVFNYKPVNGEILPAFSQTPQTDHFLKKQNIYHAIWLPDSTIAIATLFAGSVIIDLDGNILKHLDRLHGTIDNTNYFLGVSNQENLWICTGNGLSIFNIRSPFLYWDYSSGLDGIVLAIERHDDKLYVGTLNGLFVRIADHKVKHSVQHKFNKLINSDIWDISKVEIDGIDFLYFASGQGLFYIRDGLLFKEVKGDLVHKILQSKMNKNVLFIFYRDKIDVYTWNTQKFVYSYSIDNLYSSFRSAMEDVYGSLWVSTRTGEIHKLCVSDIIDNTKHGSGFLPPGENIKQQSFSFDSHVVDVFDYRGIPIVHAEGLYEFSYPENSFHQSGSFVKSVSGIGSVSAFMEDAYNNIWLGGNNMLIRQPEGTYTLHKMPFKHLKDVFSSFVFKHDTDGKTWIGGNKGLYLFDNLSTTKRSSTLNVLIRKIVINDSLVLYPQNIQSDADLLKTFQEAIGENIIRKHRKLSIFYALPYFEDATGTRYSYVLNGYQDQWSEWSEKTYVDFNNLQPGEYHFEVKAKNIFDEESAISGISFYIPRPWYKTTVFFVMMVSLFLASIYLLILKISKIKLKKQLRLEEIIQNRIKEDRYRSVLTDLKTDGTKIAETILAQDELTKNLLKRDVDFVQEALNIIDTNLDNSDFDVKSFCEEMSMSQAQLYRKLNALVGMSITGFIRNTRLKKAAQLLWETDLTISEVAYETGFNTPGYFTKCFSREFGITPSEFLSSGGKIL